MQYKLSDKVSSLKPSVIREIFKFCTDPNIIPLSAGNPAPEAFPAGEVAEISAKILAERPIDALQYSITEGYAPLVRQLTERMKNKFDSVKENDQLFITSGGQQTADFVVKTLCNEGDVVLVENPSFIGALNSFRSNGARLRSVDLQEDGIDLNALETALREEKNAKLLYIIPNFQNPAGLTTSWEKRVKIYELCKKYGVMIMEDNPYGEIRVAGEDVPNIKSIDEDGIVVYAGSFSKVIAPGIRVGWCIAPKEVAAKMIVCKQGSDVHTNIWAQLVADSLLRDYDFEAHLSRIRSIYRGKLQLALDTLEKNMPSDFTWTRPQGGLFIWCTLPDGIDMLDFCKKAIENKVAVVPGNAFLVDENVPCNNIRINFSTPTDEQLVKGIEILAKTLEDMR
ncbi:MAG: PLP-dependent aminotransferase family protein [Clostridia bacterium]|nr:PLP-dependent aminotransferase family protein [Clostridia bacterium]